MRRLLWVLLVVLTLALVLLVLRQRDAALLDLIAIDEASLETKIMALALLAMIVLVLLRQHFARVLESILIWLMIAMLLALGYAYRFELRDVGERVLAELVPGRTAGSGRTVEVARDGSGGFSVAARVNGARIAMVVDTGASAVVLTQEAARAAGLPLEVLNYSVSVDTANGRARAAPVTLDRVSVGGITERAVPALVAQPGQLRMSLLGMTFLNRLERWEVRGDKLSMRGYP